MIDQESYRHPYPVPEKTQLLYRCAQLRVALATAEAERDRLQTSNISWSGFTVHSADPKSIDEVKRLIDADTMNDALRSRLKLMMERDASLQTERERLREALKDMRSGWRYIRQQYGDLAGVGWDRCEDAASAALGDAP